MRKSRFIGLLIILVLVVGCDVYEPHLDDGTGVMQVLEGSFVISEGGIVNFGTLSVSSGSASKTFTIKNIGDGTLVLDDNPLIISGTIDHWSQTQPATSIAKGQSTTFQITFDPASTGVKNNSVYIYYADSTYWDFIITGAGN